METGHTQKWFTEVFDNHYEHLRNYLYYLSGDIKWSEDAVQEVFLVLWEKRGSVIDRTVLPFLFTIARNNFLKKKRHDTVHLQFIRKQDLVEPAGEDIAPENTEFEIALHNAISSLPEKCRIVFLMSRMDGLTNSLIAHDLKVSVKSVEKQITKALKILRLKLEEFR
jgi:RNA polymerase sigma-70 factor (ECF subfamily)